MATLVIDRRTLPSSVSSFFTVPRIAVSQQRGGDVTLSPIIDPDDYDNDTDYLNAIPGYMGKIDETLTSPNEEWEEVPKELFHV